MKLLQYKALSLALSLTLLTTVFLFLLGGREVAARPNPGCSNYPNEVTVTLTGKAIGRVWGNSAQGYTDDSDLNVAAVHAGLLAPGVSGQVRIVPLGTKSNFVGTTAFGITTSSYGSSWCAVSLETVDAAPAILELSQCVSVSQTASPLPASTSCQLRNAGGRGIAVISYLKPEGFSVIGPVSCAPNSSCGTVSVSTLSNPGTYGGTISILGGTTPVNLNLSLTVRPQEVEVPGCTIIKTLRVVSLEGTINGGRVWGNPNDGYTDDSDLARAAVHSGLLRIGERKNIKVEPLGLRNNYHGTSENGVETLSYGSNWCAVQLSLDESNPSPLIVKVVPSNVSAEISGRGVANVVATGDASGGVPPYTYEWVRTNGTQSVSSNVSNKQTSIYANLESGSQVIETWTLNVRDSVGSTKSTPVLVRLTSYAPPKAVLVPNKLTVTSQSAGVLAGSVQITEVDGKPPYTYSWMKKSGTVTSISDNNLQSPQFTANLQIGEVVDEVWTATVTDSLGVSSSIDLPLHMEVASPIVISFSPTPLVSTHVINGVVEAEVASSILGGVPPYVYIWSPVNNGLSTLSDLGIPNPKISAALVSGQSISESWRLRVVDSVGSYTDAVIPIEFHNTGIVATDLALELRSCTSNTPTSMPSAASMNCTLFNLGSSATSQITYDIPSGVTLSSGPTSCSAHSVCGQVNIITPATVGKFSGTLIVSPDNGTGASQAFNLEVLKSGAKLELVNCSSNSPSNYPMAGHLECTLRNTGDMTAYSIAYNKETWMIVSAPTTCAAKSDCGLVIVDGPNSAGSFNGSLNFTVDGQASVSLPVNLQVNGSGAKLELLNCKTRSPLPLTSIPNADCELHNVGQTEVTSINYSSLQWVRLRKYPPSCPANGLCGLVRIVLEYQGEYSGNLIITPNTGLGTTMPYRLEVVPEGTQIISIDVSPNPLKLVADQNGDASGSVTANVSGGTSPYRFSWTRKVGTRGSASNADTNRPTISAFLSPRESINETWMLTVIDANNVVGTQDIAINFVDNTAIPITASITPAGPISLTLEGPGTASQTLTAAVDGGVPPYSYSWTRVAGGRSSVSNPQSGSAVVSANLISGDSFLETWKLSVTDAANVVKDVSVSINFKVNGSAPPPSVNLASDRANASVNVGGTASFNFSGGGSVSAGQVVKLELFKDSGTGFGSTPETIVNGSSAVINLNYPLNLTKGVYRFKLKATSDSGQVAESNAISITVTENTKPVIYISRSPSPIVAGQPYVTSWSAPGATSVSYNCTGGITGTLPPVGSAAPNTAPDAWVNSPLVCTWNATGLGGNADPYTETLTTLPAGTTIPIATLSANNANVRVAAGQAAQVSFNGSGTVSSGVVNKIEIYQDGLGSPIYSSIGANSTMSVSYNASLSAGVYRFMLKAYGSNGVAAFSNPIFVNVTDAALLGEITGIRSTAAGGLELTGWTCEDTNAQALNYSVYANAPSKLGGTLVGNGIANIATENTNATIQANCHTQGAAHHFKFNLDDAAIDYGGSRLFVEASVPNTTKTITLPCADYNCTLPDAMRIGITSPTEAASYPGPAVVFMQAKLQNMSGTPDEVAFNIDGEWIVGQVDTNGSNLWFANKANVASRATPYRIYAKLRKGNVTIYSTERLIYVGAVNLQMDVAMVSPINGSTAIVGTALNLQATAIAKQGSSAVASTVRFYSGSTLIASVPVSGGNANGQWTPTVAGQLIISSEAFDSNGASLGKSATVSLNVVASSGLVAASATPIPIDITPPYLNNADAGSLPGSLSVDKNGSATYSIPIAVPPGVNGMVPSLSLNYSSDNTTGSAGLGWSLGGISNIDRCGKIVATDGNSDGVRFEAKVGFAPYNLQPTDRLCLDGQRLILINGNQNDNFAYWASNAVYRTEVESFRQVTTNVVNGVRSFTVTDKSGHVSYYGNTPDSYLTAIGRKLIAGMTDGLAHRWRISRTEDRNGNYISYAYENNTTTGENKPSSIRWGGNTKGQGHFAKVVFAYDDRVDARQAYLAGARNDERRILKSITTTTDTATDGSGGTTANVYNLVYGISPSSGRSLLKSVQICDGNATCLPATTFAWGETDPNATKAFLPLGGPRVGPNIGAMWPGIKPTNDISPADAQISPSSTYISGDFNGDGKTDLLERYRVAGNNNQQAMYISNSDGTDWVKSTPFDHIPGNMVIMEVGDFDGDGLTDILIADQLLGSTTISNWRMCWGKLKSNNRYDCTYAVNDFPTAAMPKRWNAPNPARLVKDFNNDGRDDIYFRNGPITLKADEMDNAAYMCIAKPAPALGFTCTQVAGSTFTNPIDAIDMGDMSGGAISAGTSYADIDGDGRVDTLNLPKCIRQPKASGGVGYEFYCGSTSRFGYIKTVPQVEPGGTKVFGDFYPLTDTRSRVLPAAAGGTLSGDLNADGFSDIVFGTATLTANGGAIASFGSKICYSRGDGRADCYDLPSSGLVNGKNLDHLVLTMNDFNGDGIQDVLRPVNDIWTQANVTGYRVCRIGRSATDPSGATHQCENWSGPTFYTMSGEAMQDGDSDDADVAHNRSMFMGDFDGSGRQSILTYFGATGDPNLGKWQVWVAANQAKPGEAIDKLLSVTNGFGAQSKVSYAQANDASVYTPTATLPNGTDAVQGKRSAVRRQLVKSIQHSTGNGYWNQANYNYAGYAVDATGRGSLGFAQVTSTNVQTGIKNTTWYWQAYPHTGGMRWAITQSVGGVVLSESTSTPDQVTIKPSNTDLASTILPYVKSSTVSKRDLGSQFMGTTTTTSGAPDAYGNVSSTTTTSTDNQTGNFVVSKTLSYENKTWPLSNMIKAVETRTVPGNSIMRTVDYAYDSLDQLTSEIREQGNAALQTQTTYDRSQNSFGLVNKTSVTYFDPQKSLTRTIDVATVDYTANGRFPSSVKNAVGHTETKAFDSRHGAATSVTDANGLTTTIQNDGFGRKLKVSTPDGTDVYTYQKQCQTACPSNAVSVLVQDTMRGSTRVAVPSLVFSDSSAHAVRSVTWGFDGQMIGTEVNYDSQGRVYESYQPRFITDLVNTNIASGGVLAARNFYDDVGRIIRVESAGDAGTETNLTSYQGLLTVITNAETQSKKEYRDVWGRLTETRDANDKSTLFTYDAFNSLTRTQDSFGNVVTIDYDNLGRRTKLSDPDLGQIDYVVDPLGRTIRQVSPNLRKAGTATTMVYDDLGRMTDRNEPDLTSRWIYDKQPGQSCVSNRSCGKLVQALTLNGATPDNTETHSFDNYGRPSVSTQQRDVLYTHTINYDAWGRPLGETHQRASETAKVFERRYNKYGYVFQTLRGITTPSTGYQVLWQANEMNARQQLSKAALGNSLNVERLYFTNTGHLQTAMLTNATGGIQLQEAYQYKPLGNVMNRTQSWGVGSKGEAAAYFSEDFTYDNLNRLATATVSGMPMQTFTYDDIGNLKSKTGVGQGLYDYTSKGVSGFDSVTGASLRRPHAVQSIPGIGSFIYDDNGNLTSGAGKTVNWTSFDMPSLMTKGSENSSFTYGADHQRVKQIRSDGVTTYYAAGMEVENKAGTLTIKTYWPGGLGVEIDKPSQANQATELLWTHTDRIGSPIAITDIGGGLVERMGYDSWGKRRALNGAEDIANIIDGVKDNKGFTGHEMLDKLDLVHMNGRIYDPFTARFMSADPIIQDPLHSQSYNRYTYVWNNPTNLTDPTGFVAAGKATSSQQMQCSQQVGCQVAQDGSLNYFGYDDDDNWVQTGSSNEGGDSNSSDTKNISTKNIKVAPTLTFGNVFDFGKGRLEGIVDGAVDTLTGIGSLLGDTFTWQSDPMSQIAMAQRMDTLSSAYYTFGPAMQDMARRHITAFREGRSKESGYIQGNVEGPKVFGAAVGGVIGKFGGGTKLFKNKFPKDIIDVQKIVPNERLSGISGNFNYIVNADGKLIVGRSGHTSLSKGLDVMAAGEVQLYNGKIKWLDNFSGHYQPSGAGLSKIAESAFNSIGIDASGKFIYRTFQ